TLLAILPDEGSFEDVQAGLDVSFLDNIRQNLVATSINLKLPKVEFETEMGLVPTMKSLGMIDAFTGAADFTGIRASGGLMITDIFHKAFVKIDEEGTEAAAATAVVVGETSAPMGEVDFFFERPYIFLIQDNSTGAVLFMGRVMNPAN
ncbi:serpin family protein, partial [Myxococcota bacterium]|nr:serpin family protein [Myxococcota bacterium]